MPEEEAKAYSAPLSGLDLKAYNLLKTSGPYTSEEVGMLLDKKHHGTYSAVMSRLHNKHRIIEYVYDEDGEPMTRQTTSGRPAKLYQVVRRTR